MVKNVSFAPGVISPVIRNVCVGLSFADCTNQEIMVESMNSNFNCVCQINLPSDVKENQDKYIFKHSENGTNKDSNILYKNDEFEKLSIDPKFKY